MTDLPILSPCEHRRELSASWFCVHWNNGDRNNNAATPITPADCQRCIVKEWANKRPRKEPTAATPTSIAREPGIARKAYTATAAYIAWAASGFPKRTKEEVEQILAICAGCEFVGKGCGGKPKCTKCGCGLRTKAGMATEHCPLEEPKW